MNNITGRALHRPCHASELFESTAECVMKASARQQAVACAQHEATSNALRPALSQKVQPQDLQAPYPPCLCPRPSRTHRRAVGGRARGRLSVSWTSCLCVVMGAVISMINIAFARICIGHWRLARPQLRRVPQRAAPTNAVGRSACQRPPHFAAQTYGRRVRQHSENIILTQANHVVQTSIHAFEMLHTHLRLPI